MGLQRVITNEGGILQMSCIELSVQQLSIHYLDFSLRYEFFCYEHLF